MQSLCLLPFNKPKDKLLSKFITYLESGGGGSLHI